MWNIEKIVSKGEYNYCIVIGHPFATKNNYVLHHRVVMENHLGRLLDANEVVHHINGEQKDNRIENLELLSRKQHTSFHQSDKGRKWVELCCPWCKKIFHREHNKTYLAKNKTCTYCSAICRGKFSRLIQLQGVTYEVEEAISGNLVSEYRRYSHDNPEQTT